MARQVSVLITVLLLIGNPATGVETTTVGSNPEALYYLCKNGDSVRTIRVQKHNNMCHTFYTKEGVDSMVSQSWKAQVCEDIANKIKTNLEAGNWKCRDISQARVSSSNE